MPTPEQILPLHEAFWRGEGPSLILIPTGQQELYDLKDYSNRFHDPRAMWESEMRRAEPVVDWPTDGIATARPNLGVVFIPATAGQSFRLPGDAMPWPGAPLARDAIRMARGADIARTETMRLAKDFYAIHAASGRRDIAAYHADTQGVFDIAHLLYGDEIFCDMAERDPWVEELLAISLDLYLTASKELKSSLGEKPQSMIHGHGTPQGVWFPDAGVRMAEDTATLISADMISRFILPTISRAAAPFGSAFVHFCGKHEEFFERLCGLDCVRAIDLGNPESYDARWLLEQCAATDTVLYSRLHGEPTEDWRDYVRRIGNLVRQTRASVILRPARFPDRREDCATMRAMWHDLTVP